MKITPEILRDLFEYNPETGEFCWKYRDRKYFANKNSYGGWNTLYAGKPAFIHKDYGGYLRASIFAKFMSAHRVAWAIHYGDFAKEIDHIDGDRTNNRISNLRSVTRSENCRNRGVRSDNSSGRVGVYWAKNMSKWRARITLHGKETRLGSFENYEDAVAAREDAEKRMGFHENHGKRLAHGVTPEEIMNGSAAA